MLLQLPNPAPTSVELVPTQAGQTIRLIHKCAHLYSRFSSQAFIIEINANKSDVHTTTTVTV